MSSPSPLGADYLAGLLSDSPVRETGHVTKRPATPSADEWLDLFADDEIGDPDRPPSTEESTTSAPNEPGRRPKPEDPAALPGLEHLFTTVGSDGGEPPAPNRIGYPSSTGIPRPVHRGRPSPDPYPPPPTRSAPSSGFVFVVDGERRPTIEDGADTEDGLDVERRGEIDNVPGDRPDGSVLSDVAWPVLTARPPSRSVRSPGQARRRLSFLPDPVLEVGSRAQFWGVVLAAAMVAAGAGAWNIGVLDWLNRDVADSVTLSGATEGVTPAAPIDEGPGSGSSVRARSGGLGPVSSLVSGTDGTGDADDAESDTRSEPGTAAGPQTTAANPSGDGSGGSVAGSSLSSATETTAVVTSSSVSTTTTPTTVTAGSGTGSTSSASTTSTTRPETTTTSASRTTTSTSSTSTSAPSSTTTSVATTTSSTTTTEATASTTKPPEGGD